MGTWGESVSQFLTKLCYVESVSVWFRFFSGLSKYFFG